MPFGGRAVLMLTWGSGTLMRFGEGQQHSPVSHPAREAAFATLSHI